MNNNINRINIDNLIALCHIIEDYESFTNNLLNYISKNKNNFFIIEKLDEVSRKRKKIYNLRVKNFYYKNKKTIDIINKYTSLSNFVNSNYDYHDNHKNGYDKLNYYYNYLLNNIEKIDNIINLLNYIKKLGFKEIDLNEKYDFTKDEYYLSLENISCEEIKWHSNINYLENINILPNYNKNSVYYKTTNSNYRIIIKDFSLSFNEIMVNNLLFDSNKLPKNITKEETIDKIIDLKMKNKEVDRLMRNAIDLSVTIDDLEKQYHKTNQTINNLDSVENKDELIKILEEIKKNILLLKVIEHSYNNSIINNNKKITEEDIIKEKKLYLDRRFFASIDLC